MSKSLDSDEPRFDILSKDDSDDTGREPSFSAMLTPPNGEEPAVTTDAFERERDVNAPGGGHNLKNYWVRGEGAAKIGWGTDGSFARCVGFLSEHVKNPQGLCAEYHKAATGEWPAEKGVESVSEAEAFHGTHNQKSHGNDGGVAGDVTDALDTGDIKRLNKVIGKMTYNQFINLSDAQLVEIRRKAPDMSTKNRDKIYELIRYAEDAGDLEDSGRGAGFAVTAGVGEGDCPPGTHKMEDGSCMADDDDEMKKTEAYAAETEAVETAQPRIAPWRGTLTVEGIESGDGRMFAANGLTWDEPPLPLMWQRVTSHGGTGDESVRVGSITKVWREPDPSGRADVYAIRGEGTLDLGNPDGVEVYRRMLEGDMRGNSVDVDSIKGSDVELIYPDAPLTVAADESGGEGEDSGPILINSFAQPELTKYKKGRIRASTMVEIPAFTEARLELTDEVLTAAAAEELALELNGEGMDEIERELAAITAAVSTIEIADAPPREWFVEPTDVTPTGALTVTQEGRVYGYIAPAGVRHRSFGHKSVYVPLKNVDYGRFMGGETIVADGGRVATGAITMGCGHATTDYPLNAAEAKDHYDNTCALVATVCAGENKNGVWIAGALLPDVTPHQVRRMMACRLSGDWRPHMDKSGWRELTAALLVPVPGFPMARSAPSVQVAEGQLVAASVPVQFLPGPTPQERAAAIVRQVRVAQLRSRVNAFHGTHNQKSHGNGV